MKVGDKLKCKFLIYGTDYIKISIGKIYTVLSIQFSPTVSGIIIKDDYDMNIFVDFWYIKLCFINLTDERRDKLNKLNNVDIN